MIDKLLLLLATIIVIGLVLLSLKACTADQPVHDVMSGKAADIYIPYLGGGL